MKRRPGCVLWMASVVTVVAASVAPAQIRFDLGTAVLTLDERGRISSLALKDGSTWPVDERPVFVLETDQDRRAPTSVQLTGERLLVRFQGGSSAEFVVRTQPGLIVFELTALQAAEPRIKTFRLFHVPVPPQAELAGALNACSTRDWSVAVMGAEPNVLGEPESSLSARGDRSGCSHEFVQAADQVRVGQYAARFTATCDDQPGGWSVRGKRFPAPLDLTGCQAIRAWVHGDGQGEQLKIQLYDGAGGYRDNYLPIDFQGWRQVTLVDCPINTLRYAAVDSLSVYYNGLPPGKTVTCGIDHIEAIMDRDGRQEAVLLEDFESPHSPWWSAPGTALGVSTSARHGLTPARFGVVVSPRDQLLDSVMRFEQAAGVPSPAPGGAWNKRSPWIDRSYYFLTAFRESQFDEALAIARRGGFDTILIDQGSWCRSTGHFEVNRDNFPDGLDGLVRTVKRFKEAGFRVGLHFLAASIYPPDEYLTPVPDPRLVKGATVTLEGDVDSQADFLPTAEAPSAFPAEDGGYEGDGTVLQIGEELIQYAERSLESPYGFRGCQRGYLGTRASAHQRGDAAAHLVRAYGYHMFDMDTTLLDEVTTNFARVANACDVDMLYFDGSERLQGDHWYYNAKLHKAYYDKLNNKDVLLQASSFSHYSWHLLARSASADGHGDLKGYLDERSPWFTSFDRTGMPLDIGWYYGYDPSATTDMFEYVLGATIGYDSSMSFQVSVDAARQHPFTGDILDLIRRYEQLRLSGRIDAAMKERLRIDPRLGGKKEPAERASLLGVRREYRLRGEAGREVFQRVMYEPWHAIMSGDEAQVTWPVHVATGPVRAGVQIHAIGGAWLRPGPSYDAAGAVVLETFDDLAPYARNPSGSTPIAEVTSDQGGAVLPGVTQRLELRSDGAREGTQYAVYTAQSALAAAGGWSAIGKQFDPPLDLSAHRGIGFWLRGDGRGGSFKLQLGDSRGAMDYYITNDFEGWRYQQLARPAQDPIDYSRVTSLMLYYNNLPGQMTVACGIDDIKALPSLDEREVVDPVVEIGDQRFAWEGTLREGQYLTLWPGEPVTRHGPPLTEPERSASPAAAWVLPAGDFTARFHCRAPHSMPVRVRVTLQPPECHEVKAADARGT
jgi:hypothetical protein